MLTLSKLKRCPFCGTSAKNVSVYDYDDGEIGWSLKAVVQCNSCGASSGVGSNKADAIKKWNTRIKETYETT